MKSIDLREIGELWKLIHSKLPEDPKEGHFIGRSMGISDALRAIEGSFTHTHVAGKDACQADVEGSITHTNAKDVCLACRLDLRNNIHRRTDETALRESQIENMGG